MPRLTYDQNIRIGNVSSQIWRDEILNARPWAIVKLVGFILGCLFVLYWVFQAGSAWGPGKRGATLATPTVTTTVATHRPIPTTVRVRVDAPDLREAAARLESAAAANLNANLINTAASRPLVPATNGEPRSDEERARRFWEKYYEDSRRRP